MPDEVVKATKEYASPQVRAMIDLQLLTGMRPGEVCAMRLMDMEQRGEIWEYRPESHKTAHHGHQRIVNLGPRAQSVLKPFMIHRPIHARLFSPTEAEEWHRAQRSAKRVTPLSCGNSSGTNCKRNPRHRPGDSYNVDAFRKAIARAADAAYMPAELKGFGKGPERALWKKTNGQHRWHPHQLRHTAATRIRREYGAEKARAVLGHRHLSVTETYAEVNTDAAREIMRSVG